MKAPLYKKINRWRVVPRVLVALYGWLFVEVSQWFMHLEDPNNAQAAFVSTFVGAAAAFFKFYSDSGKDE